MDASEYMKLSESQRLQVDLALRLVKIINESIRLAHHSKVPATKVSKLQTAKTRLEELQNLAADHAFIKLEGLEDVQKNITDLDADFIARGVYIATTTQTYQPRSRFCKSPDSDDDIIVGYRILATLDFSTREICRALDGRKFPKHQGPRPPFYRRCRCVSLPVLNMFEDLGLDSALSTRTRASVVGQVPAAWSYYKWLSHQPSNRDFEVLGHTRSKLFRDGGLSPQQFAALQLTDEFKPRTLKEMEALAPEAFIRAGISRKISAS